MFKLDLDLELDRPQVLQSRVEQLEAAFEVLDLSQVSRSLNEAASSISLLKLSYLHTLWTYVYTTQH